MEFTEDELDELVRRYEHRVRFFALHVQRSFRIGSRWWDDLVSAGYWGLFKALRNRRAGAEEWELSAYVSKRVHGAIMDEARHCLTRCARTEVASGAAGDWPVRDVEDCAVAVWPGSGDFDSGEHPERVASQLWTRSAVSRALEKLKPAEQALLRAYMGGASLSEIAAAAGIPAGTMQVRFEKLARRLRVQEPSLRQVLLDCEPSSA